ncbi:MAG: PQQ-binding-like beta-propeller repeat protein [Opitutaceae bacterium]|nr:PQQ-binding-like beta-propeller repeat protein [Opitutaceae bacterium]
MRLVGVILTLFGLAVTVSGATVKGRVFIDRDRDGIRSAQEPGLGGVVVSDGRNLVVTTAGGDYEIEVEKAPFVFVVLPRGYRAHAHRFYADAKTAGPIDFALVDWAESRADAVRLVQISDTHVKRGDEEVRRFGDDIAEINALEPKAAFALATGDLVNVGKDAKEFEAYVEGIAHFELPLFNLPGNHDVNNAEGLEHYHRYLGPDNYSFNAGNCHIVLLNFLRLKEPEVVAWIRKDVAAAPKGSTLIIGMHGLPTEPNLKFFAELGAKAVLSGHWHGHRVRESQGISDLNTPPLRFGGIDRHPRSFRIVEIAGGHVRNEVRLGGFKHHGVVVAPARVAAAGKLPLLVNAYDTRVNVASVECDVAGQRVALRQTSPWSWSGEAVASAGKSGAQRVVATIRAANGDTWRAESTFQLPAAVKGPAPFRLKWAAPTGGFIGISSPRVGPDFVAIGVDDKGDLKSCGVATFDLQGKKRWHFNTDSGIKNNIAAADGRLFATSVAGTLYALDEATGLLRWKAGLDRQRERWEVTATTVANGVVHVGSNSYIAAFDAQSGKKLWESRFLKNGDWSPSAYTIPTLAAGKLLLFHLRYGAIALDVRTGATAWKIEGAFNGCAVKGDTIYTVRNNTLAALAVGSGKELWAGKDKIGSSASKPLLVGDRIVVGTSDGRVCLVSAKDGSIVWSSQTGPSLTSLQPYQRGGSDVNSSPAVDDDVVYVGASDGRVHALALANGGKLGTYDLGVPVASSPVIAGGTLYIGGYDGNLYAFAIGE